MTIQSSSYLHVQDIKLQGNPLELGKIYRPEDFKKMQCTIPVLRDRLDHSLVYYKQLQNRTAAQVNVNQNSLKQWTKIVLELQSLKVEVESLNLS